MRSAPTCRVHSFVLRGNQLDDEHYMTITISDLRRAILHGGDVSSFAKVYHRALAEPPVDIIAGFDSPLPLPHQSILLSGMDEQLSTIAAAFKQEEENRHSSLSEIDLTLVALSRYGNNAGKYIERVIDETHPDIIAVDACPIEFSAHILYACSLPSAVGLPVEAQITNRSSGQKYANTFFYPSSTIGIAAIESWLRKIPVLPIGYPLKPVQLEFDPWGGHIDPDYDDRNTWESKQYVAHNTFAHNVSSDTNLCDGNNLAREACLKLMTTLNARLKSTVREEAGYASSRILDIASYARLLGRRIRLLTLVDITHYVDMADITARACQGPMSAVYIPQKSEKMDEEMVMAAKVLDNPDHETTRAQELFRCHLDRFIQAKDSEILSQSKVDGLLAKIGERIRKHPDVARGLSVRGTIACREILGGLSELQGKLTQERLIKAAFITLPPRISLKRKGDEATIVSDVMKEVLYHIDFSQSKRSNGTETQSQRELSAADILAALNQFGSLPAEESTNISQVKSPAVVPEIEGNREALTCLEEMDYVRMDERGQHVLTKKALEFLMNGLEEKLKSGQISLAEYHRQKSQYMRQMESIAEARPSPSKGELASTIVEMIDAQDKQWNNNVSFNTMYVYYHIKANSEMDGVSRQKSDYYGLKKVIDDLVRQRILVATEEPSTANLTGLALNILLEYLLGKSLRGEKAQAVTDYRKRICNERSHEIRRYRSGDSYRNISVRRTLKEIARKRKRLSDVQKSDFRVFSTQSNYLRSDIIMCMDTSGSMGFHKKLMYARLAAAGIVQAALKDGNRIGIVAFNDYGKLAMPLTENDEESLLNFIAKVSPRGNTNIGDGIRFSAEALFHNSSRNPKHILVISDGLASAVSESIIDQLAVGEGGDLTEESALLEAKKAAAKGIQVSVIHIAGKDDVSNNFAHDIARVGNGRVYRISDAEALSALFC